MNYFHEEELADEKVMDAIANALRDEPKCRTGFYICTRSWCCIYGMKGNPASPWRNPDHRREALAALTPDPQP